MRDEVLTKTGKLREKYLPAVYFDSSVLIDYWKSEFIGAENPFVDLPYLHVVREILKSESRINKMVEIRKKLVYGQLKVTPIVSPLSLLELMEWRAEDGFKQMASEASSAIFIQRMSKKEIGRYLKKALELRKAEVNAKKEKQKGMPTGLEMVMDGTWLNGSFAIAHGLQGLVLVDMIHFHLPINKVWTEPSAYAYLQLGVSDILHILLAQHLGCKYIAVFDKDFTRVEDIIREESGMIVLKRPEEILKII